LTVAGHLMNPQVCGLSFSEVRKLNMRQANIILESVGLSNKALEKAQKHGS
jgi:hypothetical protein